MKRLMIGMLLWGIIYAVVASVDFLFGLSLKEGWYSYPSVFNWLIITPLLCCTLLSDSSGFTKGENLLRIVVDRVLSTALVIYAVILYGYIFRILIKWELPNGGVAYIVLAFLFVALVCYLLRIQVKNRHYEWFYKFFPAIAVPPLVLLWIGTFRRIGEYGITEDRFYLLVLAAFIIPVLAAVTQYLNVSLMPQAAQGDSNDQMANTMKSMNVMMPIMSAVFCWSLPTGMGIYWIAGAVIRSIQQVIINKHIDKMDIDEMVAKNLEKLKEKEAKEGKKDKNRASSNAMNTYSSMNTRKLSDRSKTAVSEDQERKAQQARQTNGKKYRAGSLAEKANMVSSFNETDPRSSKKK